MRLKARRRRSSMLTMEGGESWGKQKSIQPTANSYQLSANSGRLHWPFMASLSQSTRRRVDRRLMPFIFLLYVVSYLDRVNVGSAGLQMTKELGFSDSVFGLGGGIFFVGYFLLEVPGAILAELWSARKWIARILIT